MSGKLLVSRICTVFLLLACQGLNVPALAAPDEIVVFTDEFEKKGEVGYELHLNYAARARKTPDYAGEQPPYRIFRVMPEVVWGLSDKWNLGVHVPFSYSAITHTSSLDGIKVRLHYLDTVERGNGQAFFYGVNYEVASYNKRITESRNGFEVRGIVGMRQHEWKFTLNPIVGIPASKNSSGRKVEFGLFGQILRNFGEQFALGIEHYASTGSISKPVWDSRSEQITYLVTDISTKNHFDIHLGVGHGWNGATDKLVYKAMIGLPF